MPSSIPSKMITDRELSALAVEAAAVRHGEEAVAAFTPLLADELAEGEAFPDLALFFQLLARRLGRARRQMVERDVANKKEQIDDVDPRRRRDEAAVVLAEQLRKVRALLDGLNGPGKGAELLALGEISSRPTVVRRQAKQALVQLRSLEAPALQADGPPTLSNLASAELLAMVEPADAALEAAVEDVINARRDTQSTQVAKTAARVAYDRTFGSIARTLEALFALAGMTALADKVRPSGRRPGRTAEGDAEDPTTGDATSPAPAAPAPVITLPTV